MNPPRKQIGSISDFFDVTHTSMFNVVNSLEEMMKGFSNEEKKKLLYMLKRIDENPNQNFDE